MCPILLDISQKHTNNLRKIVFIYPNNRRKETETHWVSPGLRLSLLVTFFPLAVIRCFPYWLLVTGCSITSHKFLMSHSPVTFNCIWFLLLHQTCWRWGGGGDGNNETRARLGDSGRYTIRVLWSSEAPPPSPFNEGWALGTRPCQPAPTQHFLFGKYFNGIPLRASLRSWPQCQHIFSLPGQALLKCYQKLSAQSKTQSRPGQLL